MVLGFGLFFFLNWITLKVTASMAAAVMIQKGKHSLVTAKSIICPKNKTQSSGFGHGYSAAMPLILEGSTVLPLSSAHLPQKLTLSCPPTSWEGNGGSTLPTLHHELVSFWAALLLFICLQGQVGGLSGCLYPLTSQPQSIFLFIVWFSSVLCYLKQF